MSVRMKEAIDAVVSGDVSRVTEILDGMSMTDGVRPCFLFKDKPIVSAMLSAFSMIPSFEDLALELIERTAKAINLYSFLYLVNAYIYASIDPYDTEAFEIVPMGVCEDLRRGFYSKRVADAIEDSPIDVFEKILAYMTNGYMRIDHSEFNLPILKRIYEEEVIPLDLMFAYMASNLCDFNDIIW